MALKKSKVIINKKTKPIFCINFTEKVGNQINYQEKEITTKPTYCDLKSVFLQSKV